jgi:hypothetical protein
VQSYWYHVPCSDHAKAVLCRPTFLFHLNRAAYCPEHSLGDTQGLHNTLDGTVKKKRM